MIAQHTEGIDLIDFVLYLWLKKKNIALVVFFGFLLSCVTAFSLPDKYKSEVLIVFVNHDSSGGSGIFQQLSGVANLVGLGGGGAADSDFALAVLKSRIFLEAFIVNNDLLPYLYPDLWDDENKGWITSQSSVSMFVDGLLGDKKEIKESEYISPSMSAAVKKLKDSITVLVDVKRSLISVSVEFYDPVLAARVANLLVSEVNMYIKKKEVGESERSIDFLKKQLKQTDVEGLQQVLFALLESQVQKIMLANVKEQYVFDIVDPAVPPEYRSAPKRKIIVILGAFLFGCFYVIYLFGLFLYKTYMKTILSEK